LAKAAAREHLYGPEERIHLDKQKLDGPTEFLARSSLLSGESAHLDHLARSNTRPSAAQCFQPGRGDGNPTEIVHGGILQFSPPAGSTILPNRASALRRRNRLGTHSANL